MLGLVPSSTTQYDKTASLLNKVSITPFKLLTKNPVVNSFVSESTFQLILLLYFVVLVELCISLFV